MPSSPNASARDAADDAPFEAPDASPRRVADLVRRARCWRATASRPTKSLGQHFLVDRAALARHRRAAELAPDDEVWEVGPGLGTLTVELAKRARRVVPSSSTAGCCPSWRRRSPPGPTSRSSTPTPCASTSGGRARAPSFVANLPYHVGTARPGRVLAAGASAGRRAGAAGGRRAAGGATGHARVRQPQPVGGPPRPARAGAHRAAGAFLPPPKVTSAVVRIDLDPAARPRPRHLRADPRRLPAPAQDALANLRAVGDDPDRVTRALDARASTPGAGRDARPGDFRRLARCSAPSGDARSPRDSPSRARGAYTARANTGTPSDATRGAAPVGEVLHGRYPGGRRRHRRPDVLHRCAARAGGEVSATRAVMEPGGAGGTIATALARLGHDVAIATRVGNGPFSAWR
jgi:16S rRNA (adenine1518-N6/adenine1519-N6)-dimethyltransferase